MRWLGDMAALRAVSYFLPREDVMARVAQVMQTGRALYMACTPQLIDWEAVFEAIGVASLEEVDEASYLILDDCDVMEPHDLTSLVRTLIQETRHVRLILFAHRPLIDLYADPFLASVYQCFIGSMLIKSPYPNDELILYLESFGEGRVFANGHLVEWNGTQQLETFFILLDTMPATKETILMALFGSTSEDAYNRFQASKTYMNRVLGRDLTTMAWGPHAREQAYYLSEKITVYSDFDAYAALIRQMFDASASAESILECSKALLRFSKHDYLTRITENPRIAQRRLQLRHYLSQALVQVGRAQWGKGLPDHAEALFTRATQADRTNRDAVENLMILYRQQGRENDVERVYRRWYEAHPIHV